MSTFSHQSYLAAEERLDTLASRCAPARLQLIGDQLLAVTGLLAGDVQLRRVLADPARPGADRAALLHGLVAGEVEAETWELLDALVSARWPGPAQFLAGCGRLGVQALLASAERAGNLAEVGDELFRFGQIISGNPALAAAIGHAGVPPAQRAMLVKSLLAGRTAELTLRLAVVALHGFLDRRVVPALIKLVELAAQRQGRSVAYVTVASPLEEAEEQRLGAALSARYGREVSLKTTVDPRVLGGMRVQIGADRYDATVSHRLAQARTALAAG